MKGKALGSVAALGALPMAEDTPPDLLAGGMDLRVVLPSGSVERRNVDRSTPIMDLLVQLASAHRVPPAAHTLQAFGFDNTPLHAQPSTPIGALDVFTVKMVPKAVGKRAAPRPAPAQPFEQTFRLQVHLPRNQLFVTRASRATLLGDVRALACREKNLDPLKYELRHPANLDQRLDPESTLGECGLAEVALVAAGGRLGGQPLPDIMALRRQNSKTAQFAFIGSHTMAPEGSVSSASSGSLGGRSASPAPSDGERSTSPPGPQPLQPLQPPSRPGRKRRPAPKPPAGVVAAPVVTATAAMQEMNNNINKDVINSGGTVISHSRNSSDSSGYHEASVLSESPEGGTGPGVGPSDSLPGRDGSGKPPSLNLSRSMTNLGPSVQTQQLSARGNRNSVAVDHDVAANSATLAGVPVPHRASTSSLSAAGLRKKKAPPPPPPSGPQPRPVAPEPFLKTQSLERQGSVPDPEGLGGLDALPQQRMAKSSTLPGSLSASASACFPPVGSVTGSSSSCPTPTPSEQSVHLSEADSDLGTDESFPPRTDIQDEENIQEPGMQTVSPHLNKDIAGAGVDSTVDKLSLDSAANMDTKDDVDSAKVVSVQDGRPLSQMPAEEEWEYRLPSPPSAFRDSRSHSPTVTEFDSVTQAETNLSPPTSVSGLEEKHHKTSALESLYEKSNKSLENPELEMDVKINTKCSSESLDTVPLPVASSLKEGLNINDGSSSTISNSSNSKTVISAGQSVINFNCVPNDGDRKKLEGSAAVLDELNRVLSEQRTSTLNKQQSVTSQSQLQLMQEPAPIENFSMAAYSRPTSAEGMPPPEVRPSLVLARRSSFSNSNGCINTLPRPLSTGVRRTTSHATLVGGRREIGAGQDPDQVRENLKSEEEIGKHNVSGNRQDSQTLGRAVSAMNLCADSPISPIEPELLKEFMEWRQQRQIEQQEKERQQKMESTSELQSPQVLRSILCQSEDDIHRKSETDNGNGNINDAKVNEVQVSLESKEKEKKQTEEPPKAEKEMQEPVRRVVPRGPPSIQLSTWNERPKRQVSIKMDRDYWIGVGGAALRPTKLGMEKVDEAELKGSELIKETRGDHTSVPSATEQPSKNPPSSETVQRLSRQYIVHTTPSGFRRPAESIHIEDNHPPHAIEKTEKTKPSPSEKKPDVRSVKLLSSASTGLVLDETGKVTHRVPHQTTLPETTSVEIPVTSTNDPSRVPIVRAVELKKTPGVAPPSDTRKPLLRQNATTNSSVVYFSSGPIATSSVLANSKSVSVNQVNSTKPLTNTKKFTSVVDISGPSTATGNSDGQPVLHGPNVPVNGYASNSEPKRILPMPIVKGFKLAQGIVNRQLSAPAATPPPPVPVPPPAPVMPMLKKVPRPSSMPAPARGQDPREQLLDAIRNFGGRTKLRPTT